MVRRAEQRDYRAVEGCGHVHRAGIIGYDEIYRGKKRHQLPHGSRCRSGSAGFERIRDSISEPIPASPRPAHEHRSVSKFRGKSVGNLSEPFRIPSFCGTVGCAGIYRHPFPRTQHTLRPALFFIRTLKAKLLPRRKESPTRRAYSSNIEYGAACAPLWLPEFHG